MGDVKEEGVDCEKPADGDAGPVRGRSEIRVFVVLLFRHAYREARIRLY
jgi:hypothetical protein